MVNNLSFRKVQNIWNKEIFYDEIIIDDLPINEWFGQFNHKISEVNFDHLVSSLNVIREEDIECFWLYLGQLSENDKYLVPILVCSDDLNFSCIVIVAEQLVKNNCVYWLRFGNLLDIFDGHHNSSKYNIQWLDIPTLVFDRKNFIDVFSYFANQIKEEYYHYYNQKLNIKIPADKPKEDWEIIVDGWYN